MRINYIDYMDYNYRNCLVDWIKFRNMSRLSVSLPPFNFALEPLLVMLKPLAIIKGYPLKKSK